MTPEEWDAWAMILKPFTPDSPIATLREEEAIAETFRTIQDVGRWWP